MREVWFTPHIMEDFPNTNARLTRRFGELRAAYKALGNREVTDDCMAVELNGSPVKIVASLKPNFKITTVEDLQLAGALLR